MNVIFAGSPASSAKILRKMHFDGIDIKLVISQPDKRSKRGSKQDLSDVSRTAEELGLKIVKPLDLNNEEFKKQILSLEVDFLIVSAYGKIIPEWLLNHPDKLPINVHFSLLPKYRGASPIQSVLVNGDNETGISFMEMNQSMDEGNIIKIFSLKINETDNKVLLEDRLSDLAVKKYN
jgi:methionyl-tRNA formyltransferase